MNAEKGFTLIEAIIVIAVLAILAGTLVPLAIKNIEDSKLSATAEDVRALSSAVTNFIGNTGEYPTRDTVNGKDYYEALYSGTAANNPTGLPAFPTGNNLDTINNHLITNGQGYSAWDAARRIGWHGPYLAENGLDPWGRSYLVSTVGFFTAAPWDEVWVISAGRDANLDTDLSTNTLGNDDIGIIIYVHD